MDVLGLKCKFVSNVGVVSGGVMMPHRGEDKHMDAGLGTLLDKVLLVALLTKSSVGAPEQSKIRRE